MARSISRFFDDLGFPFHNERWSWGAKSERGILLRAWADRLSYRERKVRVLGVLAEYSRLQSLGLSERIEHLRALWDGGIAGYAVIAIAKDPQAHPREIKGFRDDAVYAIERLERAHDGSINAIFAANVIQVRELIAHAEAHRTRPNSEPFPVKSLNSVTDRPKH